MAIYHLNARGIAPARGSSAVASAAYQSGETLRDEVTGELKRYARAERIADTGIVLPEGAPAWDRQSLWNEARRAYGGGNELVAKRFEFALPRELDLDEQPVGRGDQALPRQHRRQRAEAGRDHDRTG